MPFDRGAEGGHERLPCAIPAISALYLNLCLSIREQLLAFSRTGEYVASGFSRTREYAGRVTRAGDNLRVAKVAADDEHRCFEFVARDFHSYFSTQGSQRTRRG